MPKEFDPRIKAEVAVLGLRKPPLSAAEIRRRLEEIADKERLPRPRTIAAWLAEVRATDTSGPWRLGEQDAEEAEDTAAILDTLHVVITRTGGEVNSFTVDEAEWVARLRRSAGLPAWEAYVYARRYTAAGGTSAALDVEVATFGDDEALHAATRKRRLHGRSRGRSEGVATLTVRKGDDDDD